LPNDDIACRESGFNNLTEEPSRRMVFPVRWVGEEQKESKMANAKKQIQLVL